MADRETSADLEERLRLIESMVLEGRRSTEYWGWMFLLWGVGYLVAIGWAMYLPHPRLAWPVAMVGTLLAGLVTARWKAARKARAATPKARAIGAIWTACCASLFLFAFGASWSGHGEPHAFLAAIEVLLGAANAASGITLRWRAQIAVAGVWWAAAVASCFVNQAELLPVLVAANLIGNIGFGIYLTVAESRAKAAVLRHA